jgi:hypothetical protein
MRLRDVLVHVKTDSPTLITSLYVHVSILTAYSSFVAECVMEYKLAKSLSKTKPRRSGVDG